MHNKIITIFRAPTEEGVEFYNAARDIASECGYFVSFVRKPTIDNITNAVWGDGLVVFDASIEPEGKHNYHCATYSLLNSMYSVVVSRTYLPINFRGHLEPIAPPYPDRWTNSDLLAALKQRLGSMTSLLPKPKKLRTFRGGLNLLETSIEKVREKRKSSFDIFLSYRASHAAEAGQLSAEILQETGQRLRIVRTDDMSYTDEILSLQRRWQILRGIYDSIQSAREFWVLWSADYLDSWWTQGELVMLAWMKAKKKPVLSIRSLNNDSPGPAASDLLPRLTKEQHHAIMKRLFLSNLPESLTRIRDLAKSRLARTLLRIEDPILDISFTEDAMLECRSCMKQLNTSTQPDVDKFLSGGAPVIRPVSHLQLLAAGNTGILHCPVCHAKYSITGGMPRYWWYPVRQERGTGPKGTVLEEHPIYRAQIQEASI